MKIIGRETSTTVAVIVADGPTFSFTDRHGVDRHMRVRRVGVTWVRERIAMVTLKGPGVRADGSDIAWATHTYTMTDKVLRPAWLVRLMFDEGWDW